jgi:pyruvate ferredoxin oxidoreductase beta subunit
MPLSAAPVDDDATPAAPAAADAACAGCGEAIAARHTVEAAMRASDERLVVVDATGCAEGSAAARPGTSPAVPRIHSLSGNAAAVASGISAALLARGQSDVRVVAQGGDARAADVGIGCLCGLFERNDDVLYVCYDSERGPRAGSAPATAGSLTAIAIAHAIPYVATASVADPADLAAKVRRAIAIRGARYVHVHAPCPLGWGCAAGDTAEVARLAVQCGLFPLFEAEHGRVTAVTRLSRALPVSDYLKVQRRYAPALAPGGGARLERIEADAQRNIARFGLLEHG